MPKHHLSRKKRIAERNARRKNNGEYPAPATEVVENIKAKAIKEGQPSKALVAILTPIFVAAMLGGGFAGESMAKMVSENAAKIATQILTTSLVGAGIVAVVEKVLMAIRNRVTEKKLEELIDAELSKLP